jgi:cytochrome c553
MAGKVARWIGIGIGSLVGLATLAAGGVYAASESRLNKQYDVDPAMIAIPTDPASIEHGRHLAVAIGKCVDCHGNNLGGQRWIEDDKLGHFITPNLTGGKGGVGKSYTDKDWLRALRHGLDRTGKPLVFMPAEEVGVLCDKDMGDLIAWLKQVPPVDNELPKATVGPLGRMLLVTGELPLIAAERIDHQAAHPAMLVPKEDAAYGRYLAEAGGCIGCHGTGLSGGPVPGTPPNDPNFPPAANLTPGGPISKWSQVEFANALRTGVRPDGSNIHPFMPWKLAGQMTDTEMKAVYAYLKSVPAKETGNR